MFFIAVIEKELKKLRKLKLKITVLCIASDKQIYYKSNNF